MIPYLNMQLLVIGYFTTALLDIITDFFFQGLSVLKKYDLGPVYKKGGLPWRAKDSPGLQANFHR